MSDFYVEPGFLNQMIRGVTKWRKCPCCDIYGRELAYYNEDGHQVSASDEGAERSFEKCESCHGIGFIDITTEADLKDEPDDC